MHSLSTFLGRGRYSEATGYRTASYAFPGGSIRVSPFFGLELAKELMPDRLVILGTSGSMWSVLVEHLADQGDNRRENERLELLEAESHHRVSEEQLAPLTALAQEATGMDVELRLIPEARDDREQMRILQGIAESIPRGRVDLDLTHGFRHLGMLGFLSAYFLEALRSIQVNHLWYGALDMTPSDGPDQGMTPVLQLDGLDGVHRWIEALTRFDASGDYGVFGPLLARDGLPSDKARALAEAHFHQTTLNIPAARQRLQTVLKELEETELSGASALFREKLIERLSWARSDNLGNNQRALALRALRRRDYPRAAIFGFEAFLTSLCIEQGETPTNYKAREQIRDAFSKRVNKEEPDWKRDAWHLLRELRNAMAHGTPPRNSKVRQIMHDRERLQRELEAAINRLNNT
ncbi:TIGR02221 family CRISPR-associated protein [Thioalkalivibrio halophilus]|uniref:CRISPR-associated protein n=1 Tax=Thioalkalivibrio halophilus TaxID=252474 RepID=A0A1V3A0N5_9GAMM|nr:TIGR02221 family CRISPR-associated protein [Thioalkalivibrio halophilus]OOC10948.1 CRISPR-associated protein [Thioalkalivibrio halophilus]